MRASLFIAALLMGLMVVVVASAQDIPAEDDNECYTGGLWEGQCVTEWHWECGWYVYSWRTTGTSIPEWCNYRIGVPDSLPVLPPYPSANCFYNGAGYNDYTDFGGGWWLPASAPAIYSDPGCTTLIVGETWNFRIIYAPAPYDPEALCQAAFGTGLLGLSTGAPGLYLCA